MKTRNRIPRRPSKNPPVAHGTLRWVTRPDGMADGVIRINDTDYRLTAIRDGNNRLVGYRLAKMGTHDVYDLEMHETGVMQCDCPNYVYNRQLAMTQDARECKHGRALRKALPAVGLPLPVPSTWDGETADPNY